MKKQKKHWARRVIGGFIFLAAATLFLLACMSKTQDMKTEAEKLDKQIVELQEELAEEKNRKVEEEVKARYYSSDAYKELLARSRFNLIYKGERLYIIQ